MLHADPYGFPDGFFGVIKMVFSLLVKNLAECNKLVQDVTGHAVIYHMRCDIYPIVLTVKKALT